MQKVHFRLTCDAQKRDYLNSLFPGNSALLPSEVIYFAMFAAWEILAGNSFISCDLEVTHESVRRWEKNSSYITKCSINLS